VSSHFFEAFIIVKSVLLSDDGAGAGFSHPAVEKSAPRITLVKLHFFIQNPTIEGFLQRKYLFP
jgi:hypothetical protein